MSKKYRLVSLLFACATPAIAQQSAHVHGIASMNLAINDETLQIEFVSPAESIVGFEYEPDTAAEREAVEEAIALLRSPENLFDLPASAECTLHEVEAERHAEGDHGEHDEHGEKHAEHDEHDEHEEKHAEHDEHDEHGEKHAEHDEHEEKHADHDEHDEHAHEDSDKTESHSEFHAHFHFDCEGSPIEALTLRLFETWPRIETVRVQALTPSGQTGGNIEASDPVIRF